MKFQDKLSCVWRVWLSHSSGSNNAAAAAKYDSNLIKLYDIDKWVDFMYIWKASKLDNPANFFIDPNTGKCIKYDMNGEMKKIESINFFKNDIQPRWEYGDNSKGGYFNFSIPKQVSEEKTQELYESFVFMAVGDKSKICEHITGVRIVDTTMKNNFRCRIQIWLDYQDDDDKLEMIKEHGQQIASIFKDCEINLSMKFFNIGNKMPSKNVETHTESSDKQQKSK